MGLIESINPYIAAGEAIANPLMGHLTNIKNRKFSREMYKRQREDALSDWTMQNQYNSPAAQMKRFQEAGLNPNLIYGQTNEGATVRSSSAGGGQAESPKFSGQGLRESMMQQYDMRAKTASTQQLQKSTELMEADIHLKQVQAVATAVTAASTEKHTERTQFDLDLERELRDVTIEGRTKGVQKQEAEINSILDENERRWMIQANTLQEGVERILTARATRAKIGDERNHIKQQIENLKKEDILKDYDIEMRKKGINPGDPGYWRIVKEIFSMLPKDPQPTSDQPWKGQPAGENKRGTWRKLPTH